MNLLFYYPTKKDAENYEISLKGHDITSATGSIFALNKNYDEYSNIDIIFFTALEQTDKNILEISHLTEKNPNVSVAIVLNNPDPDFLIKLMRIGINEIITKFNNKNCLEVIHRIDNKLSSQERALNSNQSLVFMSAKGGDGSTTIAAFLAKSLASNSKYKVLLIDMALPFGDLDLFVSKGKYQFDITDLIGSIDRLDESLVKSMAHEISENFHLIPSPDSFDKAINLNADNLNTLLNILKNIYDFILIDIGSSLNPIVSEVLKISDHVYIANKVDLLSMRQTNRILEFLDTIAIPQKNISIVLNHVNMKNVITLSDVEKAVNKKVSYAIPSEVRITNFLINNSTLLSQKITSPFSVVFDKWSKDLDFLGLVVQPEKTRTNKNFIWNRFKKS
jgi:pilus assembly protein CpaE